MARPRRYPAADLYSISKRCSKCAETRLLSEFVGDKNASDGLASTCKTCARNHYNKTRKNNKEYQRKKYLLSKEPKQPKSITNKLIKKCTMCKQEKSINDFNKKSALSDGHLSYCRDCGAEKWTEWRKYNERDKVKIKGYNLKKYNLTVKDLISMMEKQDGKCAICACEMQDTKYGPCIDHCHATNKVRGLLCSRCNTGLGMFADNEDYLINAAVYIERSK